MSLYCTILSNARSLVLSALNHNYTNSHPILTTSSFVLHFVNNQELFVLQLVNCIKMRSSDVLCTALNLRVAQSMLINMSLRETRDE